MKKNDVPQHEAKAFEGLHKLLYAQDANGHYVGVPSSGWEAEEIVLNQAISEYERQAREAWQRANTGESAPLEYYMYRARMDLSILAQSTGYFKWRVRRHLKAAVFAKLPATCRNRYADALGMSAAELSILPEQA